MLNRPFVLSEEVPYENNNGVAELELTRPLGGPLWWNALLWTNFPPLSILDEKTWEENADAEFYTTLSMLNTDHKLSEQYVTYCAAREDLCNSRPPPKTGFQLTVECMQYEGVRECTWNFPLMGYIPKRDNHQPYDVQARRWYDNGVVHLGLNAEEFSQKVMPAGDVDACITIMDYAGNPSWGYMHVLMRVAGWPFRVKKIGTFEGSGEGGHQELSVGIHQFDERLVWDMLEGGVALAPTGPNGEMELQGNQLVGQKFWAQLFDLDWLGPKIDEKKNYDPEVAAEKAYVWFTVVDTITVPSTGQKGVKIQLLEEGIVPAWLDLNFMQACVGEIPLGYLNEAECPITAGTVKQCRTTSGRKVVVENANSKLVFNDPLAAEVNDFCDMGWAIFDCLYKGASVKFGPKPGKWVSDAGTDEGVVAYKASGPSPLGWCPWGRDEVQLIQAPKSAYPHERHLVA